MSSIIRNQKPEMTHQQAAHEIAMRISKLFTSYEGKDPIIEDLIHNHKYIDISHTNPAKATGFQLTPVTVHTVFLFPDVNAPYITRETLLTDPKSTLEFILAHIGCSANTCSTDHINFIVSELYRIFEQPQPSDAGRRHSQLLTPQQVLERYAKMVSYWLEKGLKGNESIVDRLAVGEKYVDISNANPFQGTGFAIMNTTSKTVFPFPKFERDFLTKDMLEHDPKIALEFILANVGYTEFKVTMDQIDTLVAEFKKLYQL